MPNRDYQPSTGNTRPTQENLAIPKQNAHALPQGPTIPLLELYLKEILTETYKVFKLFSKAHFSCNFIDDGKRLRIIQVLRTKGQGR